VEAAGALPKPSANPATMHADATDLERSTLNEKLHRAWDMISGKG
jgi:hypothetical protein